MHDQLAVRLQDDLTARIVEQGARGVLIDISSLELVDSFIGRMLGNHRCHGACARCRDGRRRHAAGRGDNARRARIAASRSADGVERRARDEPARRQPGAGGAMAVVVAEAPTLSETLTIESSSDVVRVRQRVREQAVALGFSLVDQTKLVTAASELGAQHVRLRRRRHGRDRRARRRPTPGHSARLCR